MKKGLLLGLLLAVVSIVFTVLLTKVDVQPIGPQNSSVGFSSINTKFRVDYNEKYYKVSKYLGYAALLIPGVYALIGLIQLVKGKSLAKVDKRLYILAIFYVLVLATYMLFEKVIINYRPVILDEGLEASYPSSHTLMAIFFCMSAIVMNREMFKGKSALINVCLFLLCCGVIVGRVMSGVHWFTDIIGALLIASTYITFFKALVKE